VIGPEIKRTGKMLTCKHLRGAALKAGHYFLLQEIIKSHKSDGRLYEQA